MNPKDLHTISTALAFIAVLANDDGAEPREAGERTLGLARQIREFCALHEPGVARHDEGSVSAARDGSGEQSDAAADLRNILTADRRDAAQRLAAILEERQAMQAALGSAVAALEAILHDGLTFSSEQAAEKAVEQIQKTKPA